MKEATFLGHECTDKGILPDETKCDAIRKYPVSTNADSRGFCTICNNYRRLLSTCIRAFQKGPRKNAI